MTVRSGGRQAPTRKRTPPPGRSCAAAGSDVDTRLVFSSRGWEDVIYREELERLNGEGLTVVHALTRSQPSGWTGYARRVDAEMLAEVGHGAAMPTAPDGVRAVARYEASPVADEGVATLIEQLVLAAPYDAVAASRRLAAEVLERRAVTS